MTNRIVTFIKEARVELGKVVWPSRQEVVKHTLIVIGVCVVTAVIIGVLDLSFASILKAVI